MLYLNAVSAEMAATADFIASQVSFENAMETYSLNQASLMAPLIEAEQRRLAYEYHKSQNIFGLIHMTCPTSAISEIGGNIAEGSIGTAALTAAVEFTPWDEIGDIMRANKNAFRRFKYNNPAGDGYDWHHLVEQHKYNVRQFGVEAIQNSENLVRLDTKIHGQVTKHYNSSIRINGVYYSRARDYVKTLCFAEQRQYSLQ